MLSLKEIYKSIDNLNGTLDSKESDDLLLKYMKWLCYYEDFNKAEELIAKLSPWNISSWENMLRDFKKDPNSFGEEYIKYAEKQSDRQVILSQPNKRTKRKNLSDFEKYEEVINYIESNKNKMTISRIYQTKKKISKINDENLKITLEKSLWLWQKSSKKKKILVSKTWIYKNSSFYQIRNIKNSGK